jgi:hypothetical protein
MLYQNCFSGLPGVGEVVEDVVGSLTRGVVDESKTRRVAFQRHGGDGVLNIAAVELICFPPFLSAFKESMFVPDISHISDADLLSLVFCWYILG